MGVGAGKFQISMRLLTVLTYYRPHTSGLTIYAERLAKAMVRRGHEVTVLTTQYEKHLPREEMVDGVRVVRLPVVARVSKGVIAPSFGWVATKMVLSHEAVLLHLPQFDAAGVAVRGRLFDRPTAITYHCDLLLPPGLFNQFVNLVVTFMNNIAGTFAHRVVAYTEDFASHSPFLTRYADKREVILPPVELPQASEADIAAFRQRHNPEGRPVIAMATRFASEKGVEVLLDALPAVFARFPQARVLFAGQYENVWGEAEYLARLMPAIRKYQAEGRWEFLGVLTPAQMAAFFPNIAVLVVPSLNSTESFGLVQIEAMMNGAPVVAANLPGVRQPVKMTGMGVVVPIGNAGALGDAVIQILSEPGKFRGDVESIRETFAPDANAAQYEKMFLKLMGRR